MSSVEFQIDIRGGEEQGDLVRFRPGETLQGSVRIIPESDLQARHVFVRLMWQTEGRGDRDQAVIAEQDVFQGELKGGASSYHSFHFSLPEQPWSYAGHYIQIVWLVEVSIDLALARDPRGQKTFVLSPDE